MNYSQNYTKLLVAFLAIAVAGIIGILIWSMNKGFDYSDEGYYLLSYAPNFNYQLFTSHFNFLLRGLFPFMQFDIFNVRMLRFVLTLISSLAVASAVYAYIFGAKKWFVQAKFYAIAFVVIATGFYSYTFGPQSISYNSLLQIVFQLFIAFILFFAAAHQQKRTYWAYTAIFAAGFIISFSFPVKPTAFGLAGLATLFLLFFFDVKHLLKKRIAYIAMLGAGTLAGFAFMAVFVANPIETFENLYQSGQVLMNSKNYTSSDLWEAFKFNLEHWLNILWIPLVAAIAIHFSDRKIKSTYAHYIVKILTIGTVLFLAGKYIDKYYVPFNEPESGKSTEQIYLLFAFIFFYTISFRLKNKLPKPALQHVLIGVFLLVIPLFGVFGTNNLYFKIIAFFIPIWFAALLIILYKSEISNKISYLLFAFITVLCLHTVYFKTVAHPYRIEPLIQQNTELKNFNSAKGIYLNSDYVSFLTDLKVLLEKNGYKKGDSIIGLYVLPGIVYLLEAHPLGGTIWDSENDAIFFENLKNLQPISNLPIIIIADEVPDKFITKLNSHGIAYPAEYKLIANIEYDRNYLVYFPKK